MSDELDKAFVGMVARDLHDAGGRCKICGCHGESCRLETGERCFWANKARTLCSAPQCLIAAERQNPRRSSWRRRVKARGRAA